MAWQALIKALELSHAETQRRRGGRGAKRSLCEAVSFRTRSGAYPQCDMRSGIPLGTRTSPKGYIEVYPFRDTCGYAKRYLVPE